MVKLTQLEKAKKALKAYQDSKKTFKCSSCGYEIRIAPPFEKEMNHKDCNGQFLYVG